MREYLKLARPFIVLLLLFAIARWMTGNVFHKPYAEGHHIFSLVTLTWMAAAFYGAFTRKWCGFTVGRTVILGATLGLLAQVVIVLAMVLSYGLGLHTYFNHPTALNVAERIPFGEAFGRRLGGLVFNTLSSGILGALGWFLGGILPDAPPAASPEKPAA